MKIDCLLRALMVLILSLALAIPAASQSGGEKIGPSNGKIVGIVVAGGAVIAVAAVVIYRNTHKHPTIVGCVSRGADGLFLTSQKNHKSYALSGGLASLKADEQVAVKGKKIKDSSGRLSFQVEQITNDYGTCHP